MTDIIELELIDETPVEIEVEFEGEYVSGTTGEEYQKGYIEGYTEGETKGIEQGYNQGYSEGHEQGYEDGSAFYNDFWDAYQENGTKTEYNSAFIASYWNDQTFKPKYDITPTNACNMFETSLITDINKCLQECGTKIDLSTGSITNIEGFMRRANSISCPSPINVENVPKYLNSMFYFNSAIQEVHLIGVKEYHTWSYTFLNAYNLTHLTIEGVIGTTFDIGTSAGLTNESIQSIIDALKDLTGGTALTIRFHATVKNKLTDEQRAQITSKNWTLA